MRMPPIPPPHVEGYASQLAAMQMLDGPETLTAALGMNRSSFRPFSSLNPWTIWMRKKTRTTTISRIWTRKMRKMRKMKTTKMI